MGLDNELAQMSSDYFFSNTYIYFCLFFFPQIDVVGEEWAISSFYEVFLFIGFIPYYCNLTTGGHRNCKIGKLSKIGLKKKTVKNRIDKKSIESRNQTESVPIDSGADFTPQKIESYQTKSV